MSPYAPFEDDAPQLLYFARSQTGALKIGLSVEPPARMISLRYEATEPVELIWSSPPSWGHCFGIERRVHTVLFEHRIAGEWFDVSPYQALLAARSVRNDFVAGNLTGDWSLGPMVRGPGPGNPAPRPPVRVRLAAWIKARKALLSPPEPYGGGKWLDGLPI